MTIPLGAMMRAVMLSALLLWAGLTYAVQWVEYGGAQPGPAAETPVAEVASPAEHPELVPLIRPFSDLHVLPTALPRARIAAEGELLLRAAPDSVVSGTFVVRAGSAALDRVQMSAGQLVGDGEDGSFIHPSKIDLHIVKVWHQSGTVMSRYGGHQRKQLIPELLLRDDGLVQVDREAGLNRVRIFPSLRDAEKLQPFRLPEFENRQVWVDITVPEEARPGIYRGSVSVSVAPDHALVLPIRLEVLPVRLAAADSVMGMFYESRLEPPRPGIPEGRKKADSQMAADLSLMREHGIDLVSFVHLVRNRRFDILPLRRAATLARAAGFPDARFLYLDWSVSFKDDPPRYADKVRRLAQLSESLGYGELWIFNQDERSARDLLDSRHTFTAAHAAGARNIVALTQSRHAKELIGLLDIAVLKHDTPTEELAQLRANGMQVLAYGAPHAAEERPGTVRYQYGLAHALRGFNGVLSYTYQGGECWDDWFKWDEVKWRPNVMAYPTVSDPIPTLQLKAFREAATDLRYLATYLRLSGVGPDAWLPDEPAIALLEGTSDAGELRDRLIEAILRLQSEYGPEEMPEA